MSSRDDVAVLVKTSSIREARVVPVITSFCKATNDVFNADNVASCWVFFVSVAETLVDKTPSAVIRAEVSETTTVSRLFIEASKSSSDNTRAFCSSRVDVFSCFKLIGWSSAVASAKRLIFTWPFSEVIRRSATALIVLTLLICTFL